MENETKMTLILSVESYGEDGAEHSIEWALVELTPPVVEHILLAVSATHALAELMERCARPSLAETQFHTHSYEVRFVQADQVTFSDLDSLPPDRRVVKASTGQGCDAQTGWRIIEGGFAGLLRPDEEADELEVAYQDDMMFRLVCTGEWAEWEATPAQGDGGYNSWSVPYEALVEVARFLRTGITVETVSVGGD